MKALSISGERIKPGESKTIPLQVAKLYDFSEKEIPVHVIRGKEDGPRLFICGAIHGDELNGIEIVRRVIHSKAIKELRGSLIAVPVVNIFGFNNLSRYLPDRRDLNRSFPGSRRGSLASRMAQLFMKEIVSKCTHGIDFHTGAIHRSNLPQIRACLDEKETLAFAKAFNSPIIIDAKMRDGSLREAARQKHVSTLLFEGGQALRFEEKVIKSGVNGCLSAMRSIGMLPDKKGEHKTNYTIAKDRFWLRSPSSGTARMKISLGHYVQKDEVIGHILDLMADSRIPIYAPEEGVVIGLNNLPLVTQGEALVHIATLNRLDHIALEKQGFIFNGSDFD